MRSASTVSGPLLSVSTPASQQNRFAAVHLLTGQLLYFIVEGKSKVKEIFSLLTTYLSSQGMHEIQLFALAFILDDEYFFADPESKLSKYSPKSWKSSSTFGLDQNGQPLLQLHLRVKFYVDTTKCLRDEITRQFYYLQLRKNMVDRGGNTEDGDQNVLPLVALGLQADLGDHTADTDISSELLEKYLPSEVYKNNEHKVKQTLSTLHKGHKGVSKIRAQTMFVQEAGLIHKSHMYRLRLNKSQSKQTNGRAQSKCNSVWLAICTNGVQLFHESLTQALSCLFSWTNICKLCFDRKKFELRPNNADRLVYYTNSDDKSQRLFVLCRETHEFREVVFLKLLANMTVKKAFEGMKWTNKKKSKFMKSTDNDVIKEKKSAKGRCKDKVSSISTAEQETTCTTVKEKVPNDSISSSVELGYCHMAENSAVSELDYSVQSAHDSSDAYLMYRHPRARAAYVDNSNQSANTSSGVYTCTSYSTGSKGMASASYTTENCCSSVDCNDSGGGDFKTAAPSSDAAADDQSTAAPPDADSAYSPSLPPDTVAASSTCADDIDDAAGSVDRQIADGVDDCDGIGGGGGGRDFGDDGTDELYDLSAAATSDGSFCGGGGTTTATSTSTDAAPKPLPPLSLSSSSSSSSTSKCGETGCSGNRCALDGYADDAAGGGADGRSRSGSVVSNSGSFRGDGSDPSESGRGARLSADELSDLIVGRKTLQTPPRKGFYPSRPTTSSTLDSDSDYVTLPPPMNFVTGAPSLSNLSLANFDCSNGTSNAAAHWDVRRSLDLLSNVVKICGGSSAIHMHHPHQCVVNSNNYLDVHKSGTAFYHQIYPTAAHNRQPPPPPPPPRPKRFDKQLEQYQQQLRSDVDFVVYPHQDPAVSRQEYAEAKEIREIKGRVATKGFKKFFSRGTDESPSKFRTDARLFLSTPNVAAASAAAVSSPPLLLPSSSSSSSSSHHRQFQQQQQHHHHHLHHRHHHHHLNQTTGQQPPPPPLPPLPPHLKYGSHHSLLLSAAVAAARAADFAVTVSQQLNERLKTEGRTYSHSDLLQAAAAVAPAVPPKVMYRRRPPPPPPPVAELQKPAAVVRPRRATAVDAATSTATATSPSSVSTTPASVVLDIESLREKSRNLDLPLISALCNDQTLLKQTNALTSTENKSTQTVTTAAATPLSSLQANAAVQRPPQPAYHPPSPAEKQLLSPVSCTKCTNGTSSFSSPPPPSFLSAIASPTVAATAVRTTAKSKSNQVVKTNTNGV